MTGGATPLITCDVWEHAYLSRPRYPDPL